MAFLRENGQELIERPQLLEPRFEDIIPVRDRSDLTDGPQGTDKYLSILNLKQIVYPYKAPTVELYSQANITIDLRNGPYLVYRASMVEDGELLVIPTLTDYSEAKLILVNNNKSLTIPANYVKLPEDLVLNQNALITIFCFNGAIYVEHNVLDLSLAIVNSTVQRIEETVTYLTESADDVATLLGVTDLVKRMETIEEYSRYVPPKITSLKINNATSLTLENGATLLNPTLTWTLSGSDPYLLNISGAGNISIKLTSLVLENTYKSNTVWTLTALDKDPLGNDIQVSASVSVAFKNKIYWGTSSKLSLDSADILNLGNSAFESTLRQTFNYNASGGRYPYYVYPAYLGAINRVTVSGLLFTDYTEWEHEFTNTNNVTVNYRVVRFNNLQNGSNIEVTWS